MDRSQKGLDYLLEKYAAREAAQLDGQTVKIGGKAYPLLPWESERRFFELRGIVGSGRIGKVCTCRIGHTAAKGTDLFALLAREAGILEYMVDSPVKKVFCIGGENVLNCIMQTENGCVCTAELAATLQEGEAVDKHEIIARNGVACDRAVDTQMPQNSIYVLGKNSGQYTDTDFELFGCSQGEAARVRSAFSLAKDEKLRAESLKKSLHLENVVKAARLSLEKVENCKVD